MGEVVRVFPLQFGRHRAILWEREGDEWEMFVRGKSGILLRRSISAKVAAVLLNPAHLDPPAVPIPTPWDEVRPRRPSQAKPNEQRA
jgi:hypothetical protein